MSLERFIYYRVGAPTAALRDAVRGMQRRLCEAHPQLRARLLCNDATWMETYAQPGGVDEALLAEIEALAARVVPLQSIGDRHIESFEPCAS